MNMIRQCSLFMLAKFISAILLCLKLVKGWIFFSLDDCLLPVKALVSFLYFKFVVLCIYEGFNF